jgi:hypothetical protein
MSTAAAQASVVAPPESRGRTVVAPRALDRTAAAITAELFGVSAASVRVELSDRDGLLALHVRTPIRAVSLARVRQAPTQLATVGTLRERAAEGQRVIRERLTALTGSAVAHVTVELTGIEAAAERRVR